LIIAKSDCCFESKNSVFENNGINEIIGASRKLGHTTTKNDFDSTFFFALVALLSAIEASAIVSL
jgi:hypothetical protein